MLDFENDIQKLKEERGNIKTKSGKSQFTLETLGKFDIKTQQCA